MADPSAPFAIVTLSTSNLSHIRCAREQLMAIALGFTESVARAIVQTRRHTKRALPGTSNTRFHGTGDLIHLSGKEDQD
jgi:hypothetical protein